MSPGSQQRMRGHDLSILRNSFAAAIAFSAFALVPALAETLPGALAKAYTNNSALNSARAGVRITDENVPIAKSGMRPTVASQSGADYTWNSQGGTRLTTGSWADPPPPCAELAGALSGRYGVDLSAVSANLYRDGHDSVAWHGDTLGRHRHETVVAIVSLGQPRRFLLRPKGGGSSIRFTPGHGDLLALGGTCQHTWDHCVPKATVAGSRISLMFREPGVF